VEEGAFRIFSINLSPAVAIKYFTKYLLHQEWTANFNPVSESLFKLSKITLAKPLLSRYFDDFEQVFYIGTVLNMTFHWVKTIT